VVASDQNHPAIDAHQRLPPWGRVRRCGGRVRRVRVLFTLLVMLY
jgi:hypothetical protein